MKTKTPLYILNKYFSHQSFRPGQLEIITHILTHQDVLAVLATGSGKSICFQVPGLILPGVTLVISPLVSLMKDQVDKLKSLGIPACYINGLLTKTQLNLNLQLIKLNKYKFIYIAPERLNSARFQNVISQLKVSLLVIDEAHCISQWGYNFRPSYKTIIQNSKNFIKNASIAAFTATANHKVQQDICQTLKLRTPQIYCQTFKRSNLFIQVTQCHNRTVKNLNLIRLIKKHKQQKGIIYCSTRKETEQLHYLLKLFKIDSLYYHAGLNRKEKRTAQLAFNNQEAKIIIATNAFGMGIDVSNIRYIIHYQIPNSIENYYQEIGRAGRDQKPAYCYSLVCKSDETIQYQLLKNNRDKLIKFKKLKNLMNGKTCRTKTILNYFQEQTQNCLNCDVCQKYKNKYQLLNFVSNSELKIIKQLTQLKKTSTKLSKQFPLSNTTIAFLALFKPKNKDELLLVPGIGKGFIDIWYQQIKVILAL